VRGDDGCRGVYSGRLASELRKMSASEMGPIGPIGPIQSPSSTPPQHAQRAHLFQDAVRESRNWPRVDRESQA